MHAHSAASRMNGFGLSDTVGTGRLSDGPAQEGCLLGGDGLQGSSQGLWGRKQRCLSGRELEPAQDTNGPLPSCWPGLRSPGLKFQGM